MSGDRSMRVRFLRNWIRSRRRLDRLVWGERTVYVDERVNEYRGYWEAAARELDAEFVPLTSDIWEVRHGDRRARICNYQTQFDDIVTLGLAGDKAYCYAAARELGLPTPDHSVFQLEDLDSAQHFVTGLEGPFVVKPARDTASGHGVSTHVQGGRALVRAACLASLYCSDLIVERMVFGESYRLLYLDGKFLHAVRRRGVHVVGDGGTDVRGLLERDGVFSLERDRDSLLTLHAQRLEHGSVPFAGRDVLVRSLPARLRGTRELRTEYDEDVTDLICDSIQHESGEVVAQIGTRLAGVDLILCDATLPLAEGGGVFIELNGTPGIHHHYVDDQRGVPVAIPVLARMLGFEFPGTRSTPTGASGGHHG